MSGQIRITPEELRGCAGQCRTYGDECESLIQKTQTLVDNLQQQWEGQASSAFASQFASLRPHMNRMRELYEELSQQMDGTANALEQVDQEIASKFS